MKMEYSEYADTSHPQVKIYLSLCLSLRYVFTLAVRHRRLRRARDPAPTALRALLSLLEQESGPETAHGGLLNAFSSPCPLFAAFNLDLDYSGPIVPNQSALLLAFQPLLTRAKRNSQNGPHKKNEMADRQTGTTLLRRQIAYRYVGLAPSRALFVCACPEQPTTARMQEKTYSNNLFLFVCHPSSN